MTDIDDEEWERWMGLTPAQQAAEVQAALSEYRAVLRGMTMAEFVAHKRASILRNCLSSRRLLRKIPIEVFREHLRGSQIQLVKLRAYRTTGTYPGEA